MHGFTLRTALTLMAALVCSASLVCSEEATCSDASPEVAPALLQVGAQAHNFRESMKEEPQEKKGPEEKPEEKRVPEDKKEPERKKEPEAKNEPEEKKEFFKAPEKKEEKEEKKEPEAKNEPEEQKEFFKAPEEKEEKEEKKEPAEENKSEDRKQLFEAPKEKKEEESMKASMKDDSENTTTSEPHCGSAFMDADIDIEKARLCTPPGLVTFYLAQKEKMNLLIKGEDLNKYKGEGASAPLTAAGFKTVTSMKCPPEMETFFTRVLDDMGLDVCSKPHVQGLMHWFSGVPDMDYQFVIDVINNGNPCKFWAPKGDTCPTLSPECENASGCR